MARINIDKIIKSPKAPIFVIPVKTGPAFGGINKLYMACIPTCEGMTRYYIGFNFNRYRYPRTLPAVPG